MVALGEKGTLAQVYANLTGDGAGRAWTKFITAVRALPGGVTSDNPFGASTPVIASAIEPMTVARAARAFGALLADIKAGRGEAEILVGLRAVMAGAPGPRARGRPKPLALPKSKAD
jgi:hypothetical protein